MTSGLDESESRELLSTARRFVGTESARLRERTGPAHREERRTLVAKAADLGWPQLLVMDGLFTPANTPVVSGIFRLIGANLLPEILIDATVLAPVVVARCGDQAGEAVGSLSDGSRYVATAFHADSFDGTPSAEAFAGATYGAGAVNGIKVLVRDADCADGFVVACRRGAGEPVLAYVPTGAALTIEPQHSIDPMAAPSRLRFENAPAEVLAEGAMAEAALRAARTLARMTVFSEIAGLAEAVTQMTVEYARSRVQFGRPIGSFQAIKHMLADLWRETYQADCIREETARRIADPSSAEEAETSAALAKAWSGPFVLRCVEAALQIHGGYGFTAEGPLSGYYVRALTLLNAEGRPRELARSVGALTLAAARA
jgi:alkylation response protein AidB-like acyl-CoA dehydrogenase